MAEESGRTRYHHGFYAAMKVEYDLAKAPVTYEQEKELGEDPVRLDFLIIKKDDAAHLTDPIGQFFRRENLFEYKSPEDGLTIDTFYKSQGYGLIYKGYDRAVNELPIEEMSLTLVRHAYPREMIKTMRENGFTITQTHPGIYHIEGKNNIDTQLVVTSRLPKGEYEGLKLLAKGPTREEIVEYAKQAVASGNEGIIENAGTVVRVCLTINKDLSKQMEADEMKDPIREMFSKEFDQAEDLGKEKMIGEMLKDQEPAEKIAKWSGWSLEKIGAIAKKKGVAIVV